MFEQFENYIRKLATSELTDEQFDKITRAMRPKRFRKKQYFLQEGDVCRYFGFVVSGSMRQYRVDDRGTEHIIRLSLEDCWIGDRESWVMLTPSIYHIDAWEDSEVLLVTKADVISLSREIPAFDEMMREIDENHSIDSQRRLNAAISMSADERFSDFAESHPEFLQRFPQHIIASYLGITKETLSRVRKQLQR